MQYDLIALDLDDTFLDSQKNISARNRACVDRARAQGAHVIIATGRAHGALVRFEKDLGIKDYTILIGGALITDPDGHIVYRNPVKAPSAYEVMQWE